MKNIILFASLLVLINITSCRKNPPNIKTHKGKFKIYKSCGVPLANKPIRLLLSAVGYKYKQIAEVWTDSLGNAEIEHYFTNHGVITLEVYLSTVSGSKSRLFDYGFNWYQYKEYNMDLVVFGNGSQIPVKLNDYANYTSSDTIFYKVLNNIGDTSDLKLRYKVGPFLSPFIDTLTFPSCSFPAINSMSSFIEILEDGPMDNTIVYGKGYTDFLNWETLVHITSFQQSGCGVIDTINFN